MIGPAPVLVVGVGNRFRGDDAAGPVAIDRLRPRLPAGVVAIESDGDPVELLESWNGVGTVVLIDAVLTGTPAGEVVRLDASDEELPVTYFRQSTHLISIPDAIELSRALGRLPERVILYGVEVSACEPGSHLSPAVSEGVDEVVAALLAELEEPAHA